MIKDFVKKHRILLDSARRVRCFITACKWIYIRIWTKIPCKLIRNLIINTYKNVHVHRSVPIYSGFEWWQGPFEVGKGSSIGFHNHIDCRIGVYIGKDVCLFVLLVIFVFGHYIMIIMIFILQLKGHLSESKIMPGFVPIVSYCPE